MVRNTENVNNENYTLKDLEYGKKSDQQEECETHMVCPEYGEKY